MNKANISYTKNHLSEVLRLVREEGPVLILDRQRPVACIGPVPKEDTSNAPLAVLARRGVVTLPKRKLSIAHLAAQRRPKPLRNTSVTDALLADREESL
jgi:antitoxin (DNA-binding transcriptional repressor) of toxin-antitoxin stability system